MRTLTQLPVLLVCSNVVSATERSKTSFGVITTRVAAHCQVCTCAVSRTDLQPWQILKLDSAFETGRRHVKARFTRLAS